MRPFTDEVERHQRLSLAILTNHAGKEHPGSNTESTTNNQAWGRILSLK